MNRQRHRETWRWFIALMLAVGGNLAAAGQNENKEEILALPKLKVTANVPLVKVAEYRMHEKRLGAAAVISGWYIYIIGGQRSHGNFVRTIERFDVQTGESEIFSALAVGRLWPRAVAVGSKIYIFGGESFVAVGRPAADIPRGGVERSAADRIAAAARDPVRPANTLDELQPETSIEVLDMTTGALSVEGKMPDPRSEFGCVYLDGSIYVIGGKHLARHARLETATNRVDMFNPATGAWRPGANLPVTTTADACLVDGTGIIVAGGFNGSSPQDKVFAFDPKTSGWSSLPSLARPRSAHATVSLGKYLFLFGDYNGPGEILAYNLKDKRSAIYTLRYEASRHAAAVANAKKIFVIGGIPYLGAEALDKIQVFQLTPTEGTTSMN